MSQTATATRLAEASADAADTGGIITLSSGHAIHDTYTSFLAPLLPVLTEKFVLSNSQAGLLNVFLQWPSVLQPVIGFLADHTNLRFLVILAPSVAAIGMSLLGVAPTYAVMAILLTLVGCGAAALHAVGPVMTANLAGTQLGRAMGTWMVGGGFGYTVGPLVIVATVGTFGLEKTPYLVPAGLLASVSLYARFRRFPSRSATASQDRPWRQAVAALRPILFPVIGITLVRAFMITALTTYLPLFLKSEGSTLWFAGAALAIFEAAGMGGSLAAGMLSDRIGRRAVLGGGMALATPLMGAFVVLQGTARLPLLIALGFCAAAIMPVMMAMMQEQFPQNRALANGLYLGVSFLSNATITMVLGMIGDGFGLRAAFVLSAFIPLLGIPLIYRLPRGHATAGR